MCHTRVNFEEKRLTIINTWNGISGMFFFFCQRDELAAPSCRPEPGFLIKLNFKGVSKYWHRNVTRQVLFDAVQGAVIDTPSYVVLIA